MGELAFDKKVEAIHDALESASLRHAFGGAIALGFYGEPRATVDVDVNVFVGVDRRGEVEAAFDALGIVVTDRVKPDQHGWEQFRFGWTPIDVFYAYDDFHGAMATAVRLFPFGQPTLPFLSAEHLLTCKVIFDRPKDWLDIDQVLLTMPEFDGAECLRWVEHVVGADDQRYRRLAAAITAIRG